MSGYLLATNTISDIIRNAHAVGLMLVTDNMRAFNRIPALAVENRLPS